jgi:large subunit ribosomal protein L18
MFHNINKIKQIAKARRRARTRAKIKGTSARPRLSVSKSLRHIYAQLIDDSRGQTLIAVHSKTVSAKGTKTEVAFAVGKALGEQALAKKIKTCVFDRGSARYHGRVKAVAEGARQAGLKF